MKAMEEASPSVGHFNFQEHLLGGVSASIKHDFNSS